jgi:hypothetical protein
VSLPVAALLSLVVKKISLSKDLPSARLNNWTTAFLVLIAAAVELIFSWHFGFVN